MTLLEAECGRCGETFNPADPDDLEHGLREDEQPCGGTGIIVGEWRRPAQLWAWGMPDCPSCGAAIDWTSEADGWHHRDGNCLEDDGLDPLYRPGVDATLRRRR